MSNDDKQKQGDPGAGQLMDMFSPPPPPTHKGATGSTIGLENHRHSEGAGSLFHLQSLFSQAGRAVQEEEEDEENVSGLQRKSTQRRSNLDQNTERTSLLQGQKNNDGMNGSFIKRHPSTASYDASAFSDLFHTSASEKTPKAGPGSRKMTPQLLPTAANANGNNQQYIPVSGEPANKRSKRAKKSAPTRDDAVNFCKEAAKEIVKPTTWIGSFMFVLYHVVFCLAAGSAIQRPHANNSILGLMTKMGALGIMFAGPVYLINIGNGIPSMFPTCDLFPAPMLASIALIIDEELAKDTSLSDSENDEIFLATFAFLAFIGMGLAGCLLTLAGVFRLANLGAFLPFPVLCGFFSAVGILTWKLGFNVDTSGKSVSDVFFSGDTSLILYALMHHVPGVIVAGTMKYLGPKNPAYVVVVLLATIATVYAVLFVTGTTLEEARDQGWFWHNEEIVYEQMSARVGFTKWLPPAPFGMFKGFSLIHWAAVWKGLQPACALSFLYLIRCALHSAALLKNVPNLARHVKVKVTPEEQLPASVPRKKTRMELFSEMVDIEDVMNLAKGSTGEKTETEVERATPTTWTLQGVMIQYGIAQVVSSLVGSFGIIPSVATSHAMFALRAERVAPQAGSILLLSVFYLTDFRLIAYVPKMAFSCLLTLAFIDMTLTWFIRSYFKTKEKMEWFVVPLIVIFAFAVGLLEAVFLGIGLSTFLFVAAFFRSGVVKFAASGLSVRSTIERPAASAHYLDAHADVIQVVILQNYLFFGNASSILAYIGSMFEDPPEEDESVEVPPLPRFVVLDMSLVTGMDTSTVGVISDILNLCDRHECKLFLSGMSASLRSVLAHAGVKPLGGERSQRKLRFFNNLDGAIGKAEDMLLDIQLQAKPPSMRKLAAVGEESGFQVALRCIDEQHGTSFAKDLAGLEDYTTPIELEPNESLYDSPSRPERGLFFIEEGVMKIERDSAMTNTRSLAGPASFGGVGGGSISHVRMRSGMVGLEYAKLKATNSSPQRQPFRLARIGVGWVVGTVEAVSGLENAGVHLAVTSCRLHYLSYSQMEKLEKSDPILMLRLYKLLSSMMAKRQEMTIGQLGTLHAIISSPAQNTPIARKASAAFEELK